MVSFSPAMREAGEAAIVSARLVVDTREESVQAGELAGPVAAGHLPAHAIEADLTELVRRPVPSVGQDGERTVWKAAGIAALDLATAVFVWTQDQAETGSA